MKVTASLAGFPALLIALLLLTSFVAGLAVPTAVKANDCLDTYDCDYTEYLSAQTRQKEEQARHDAVDRRLDEIEQKQLELELDIDD